MDMGAADSAGLLRLLRLLRPSRLLRLLRLLRLRLGSGRSMGGEGVVCGLRRFCAFLFCSAAAASSARRCCSATTAARRSSMASLVAPAGFGCSVGPAAPTVTLCAS